RSQALDFQTHLHNRHIPLPFLLSVLQTPGPSFDGLLTAFHYRLSSTDCTLGNIPKTGGFCAAECVPVRAQMGLSCRLQYKIWTEKLQRDEIPTAKLVVAFNEGPIWTV
ncbi:hypothetical protein AVEN_146728-1, partial [Araneus ventricosus]